MTSVSWLRSIAAVLLCVHLLLAQEPAYEQAVALVKNGGFTKAVPLLENLVRASPNDLRTRNLLGIALSGAGQQAEANKHFALLLNKNPRFLPALKNLAHNELALGDVDRASQHFQRALKLAPADPSIHFGLGHVAFLQGDYRAAVGHFEKANGMHLQEPLAQIRYAASCAGLAMRDKALAALRTLPSQGVPALQFEAGVLFSRLAQYDEAAARFEMARAGSFDPYKSGFNLALAYLKGGRADNAVRVAVETLKAAAPTAELHSLLAQAYEKAGRTKEAYEALRAAIVLSPQDEAAYVQLIALCLDHENQELGLAIANAGLRRLPTSSRLHVQRGVIHALDGRSNDALADFRTAVKLNPDAPLGYIAEALTLLRMDRDADAIALLRLRTQRKPNDHLANWMLAEALVKTGLEVEAVTALERSVRSYGRMPQSRTLLGKLLLARGDVERAQVELESALALDAASVSASYLLGQVYRKQGRVDEANQLFAKVSDAKAEDASRTGSQALLRIVRDTMQAPAQR